MLGLLLQFPLVSTLLTWSQECIGSIVTSLQTGSLWGWNPSRGIDSCFSRSFRPALGPTQLPVQWELGNSSGIKRLDLEADHSPSCRVSVKKGWCYSVNLPACLLGLCSDNCTFLNPEYHLIIYLGEKVMAVYLWKCPAKWHCWVVSFFVEDTICRPRGGFVSLFGK